MDKNKKWTSKKVITVAVLYAIGLFFILTNRASFPEWSSYAMWLYGIYALGNVGAKVTQSLKDGVVIDIGLSRKLIGFAVLLATAIGLMFLKKEGIYVVTFTMLATFIQNIFFIYVGGNVGDKLAGVSGKLLKVKPDIKDKDKV